jgi:hypothetical protein
LIIRRGHPVLALSENYNTMILFGGAKKMCEEIVKSQE